VPDLGGKTGGGQSDRRKNLMDISSEDSEDYNAYQGNNKGASSKLAGLMASDSSDAEEDFVPQKKPQGRPITEPVAKTATKTQAKKNLLESDGSESEEFIPKKKPVAAAPAKEEPKPKAAPPKKALYADSDSDDSDDIGLTKKKGHATAPIPPKKDASPVKTQPPPAAKNKALFMDDGSDDSEEDFMPKKKPAADNKPQESQISTATKEADKPRKSVLRGTNSGAPVV